MAHHLGVLRSDIWNEFGSLKGLGLKHEAIRDQWLAEGRDFNVPARLWKETLADTMGDINAYREAAKVDVQACIRRRTEDKAQRKALYQALAEDTQWPQDRYLRARMRKYWRRGHTRVRNNIPMDTGSYAWTEGCLSVQGPEKGNRIKLHLPTHYPVEGTIRLILYDGMIEIHHQVDTASEKPCGTETIGIDKGYTEVFVASDGVHYGEGLGPLLSDESDHLKTLYQGRNKLYAIMKKAEARGEQAKADRIQANNLGRGKLNRRKDQHTANVRHLIFHAVHRLMDKASAVVSEDLTATFATQSFDRDQKRKMASWVKGMMADAIEAVTRRRGGHHELVNAAYTSQEHHACGKLGRRDYDTFHCGHCGTTEPADENAAKAIKKRLTDDEIERYTPFKKVKEILEARSRLVLA